MRVYLIQNVYDAGIERLKYLFDEFENIHVWVSGGKDSTVLFHMVLEMAKELERLPLNVGFIDQEAEWQHTIDYVKTMMTTPGVKPYWLQVPVDIENSTSFHQRWIRCWDPEEEDKWIREKEPMAIKDKDYGTTRFFDLFDEFLMEEYKQKTASLGGMMAEESPARFRALTERAKYKWITWGRQPKRNGNYCMFSPLYDWSYTDVWKTIHDKRWAYNGVYDLMYRYGVRLNNMRVSNLHHQTAIRSLFYLQEFEPDNYNRICRRIQGVGTAARFGDDDLFVKDLPYMFKDWIEYRDYLLLHLITDEQLRGYFRQKIEAHDKRYGMLDEYPKIVQSHVNFIIGNDVSIAKGDEGKEKPKVYNVRFHNLEIQMDMKLKDWRRKHEAERIEG